MLWWRNSPGLLGVMAARPGCLATDLHSSGSRARACVESWLLRSRLAHQGPEVTGLGGHSTSVET